MALFPAPAQKFRPPSVTWKLAASVIAVAVCLLFLLIRDSIVLTPPVAAAPVLMPPVRNRAPQDMVHALVHYASSDKTPQQTKDEIMLTARVLSGRGPCNMLVFGLGYDSLMWKMLNYGGRTVFLEESDDWIRQVNEQHPDLEAYLVEYTTVLTESEQLLEHARENRKGKCTAVQNLLLSECKLALNGVANEIIQTEWDVIMVDAPRGYFPEAPGRMSAIYSASVMARSRTNAPNGTDVFVHDVERPVERAYSTEFLCMENLVEEAVTGHLWHFRIFPSRPDKHEFCNGSTP